MGARAEFRTSVGRHGPRHHPVEAFPAILDPHRQDIHIRKLAGGFSEEDRLPLVGLDQSDAQIRAEDGDGDSRGKPGS